MSKRALLTRPEPDPARDRAALEPEADRAVVFGRDYDVPARIVLLAHSKPEHVMRWFGPPGYPLTMCEMDFRVGGRFRFAMTAPNGQQMTPFGGEYLDIVPNARISYTNGFEQPNAERMTVTLTFTEENGRTRLRMEALFSSAAMKQYHLSRGYQQGVNAGLDQLADVAREIATG